MNREYKVDDIVIYVDKAWNDEWYKKVAKIIDIDKSSNFDEYLLEFKEYINGHDGNSIGNIKGKDGHCIWCDKTEFELALNHYKFKKWIKG